MSNQDYPKTMQFLRERANPETGRSMLCIVAAKSKVDESKLLDIVAGVDQLEDLTALALKTQVDEWSAADG